MLEGPLVTTGGTSAFRVAPDDAGAEADAKKDKPAYDVLARLGEVSQRVLIMTSDADALSAAYNRALERARNSRGHKFAGNHPVLTPARAAEYAQIIVSFARR